MECDVHLEHISAFLDGELGPEDERALRAHLAECAACEAELARLRSVKATAARAATSARVPRGFWRGVARRLDEVDQRAGARRRLVVRPLPVVGAAAVVVVLATALGMWLTPTQATVRLPALAQDFVAHHIISTPVYDVRGAGAIQAALDSELGGRRAIVAEFPRAQASLQGARICSCSGVPAVAQVYVTRHGPVALYQLVGENVDLPPEAIVDARGPVPLYAASSRGCNVVAWHRGELVVALVGQGRISELVSMARDMVPASDVGI